MHQVSTYTCAAILVLTCVQLCGGVEWSGVEWSSVRGESGGVDGVKGKEGGICMSQRRRHV